MALALVGLAILLAGANGANDVSRGIATLVGSGTSSDRPIPEDGTLEWMK